MAVSRTEYGTAERKPKLRSSLLKQMHVSIDIFLRGLMEQRPPLSKLICKFNIPCHPIYSLECIFTVINR